ncbi:MAG: AroM family protein, partial [Gorillibacterium sp.]|nr:AroM family protein [Gorillibacterium sp.]
VEPFQKQLVSTPILLQGALDDLKPQEIEALSEWAGNNRLHVLTKSGSVSIPQAALLPLLTERARLLAEAGAKLIVLLCSNHFATFTTGIPLLQPGILLERACQSIANNRRIGVLVPSPDQLASAEQRWRQQGYDPKIIAVPPQKMDSEEIAAGFRGTGIEQVALDCISYNEQLQRDLSQLLEVPVWLPSALAAKAVAEIIDLASN